MSKHHVNRRAIDCSWRSSCWSDFLEVAGDVLGLVVDQKALSVNGLEL